MLVIRHKAIHLFKVAVIQQHVFIKGGFASLDLIEIKKATPRPRAAFDNGALQKCQAAICSGRAR
jgi:hypothetical protein